MYRSNTEDYLYKVVLCVKNTEFTVLRDLLSEWYGLLKLCFRPLCHLLLVIDTYKHAALTLMLVLVLVLLRASFFIQVRGRF